MKFNFAFVCLFLFAFVLTAQEQAVLDTNETDALYREDQFYFGLTYNFINNRPKDLSQTGFSGGFHFGYIKDMPINTKRNKAFGIGLGVSLNSFIQNVQITKGLNGKEVFQVIDGEEITSTKNKFSTYMVELPVEYRWRTSTAKDYKFWRIYTGFKLGYVFTSSSKFKGTPENSRLLRINSINDFQYGLTLGTGFNTWNFYLYYALNPLFKDVNLIDGQSYDVNAIKIGLIFYIL